MGKLLRFLKNYCAVVTKKYWALKKEQILNLTSFIVFSFLQLYNIRGTYSKYSQNDIYETYFIWGSAINYVKFFRRNFI